MRGKTVNNVYLLLTSASGRPLRRTRRAVVFNCRCRVERARASRQFCGRIVVVETCFVGRRARTVFCCDCCHFAIFVRTAHGVFSLGLLASITQRCYDSGETWCFSSRCAFCERNVGCALLPGPVAHYFRFRLRITSVSGCASHPVPDAHNFLFWLRTTSGSGCASYPVPVAQHIRFRLRIPPGSGCASHPVAVAHYFRLRLRRYFWFRFRY